MAESTTTDAPTRARPPIWRNVRVLRAVFQVVFLVLVVGFVWWLIDNLLVNLDRVGLGTSFDYLDQPAGFQIAGSDFRPTQPVRDVLWVGFLNTIRVSAVGIVLATLLGIVVGVAGLSANWLVRKVATIYVEVLRNLPPLVVIIFVFTAVVLQLPQIQESTDVGGLLLLNNNTIGVASPALVGDSTGLFVVVCLLALVAGVGVAIWRTRRFVATGEPHHRVLYGGALTLGIIVVAWLALGRPLELDLPVVDGFQVDGGATMSANYFALLIALTIYTASYIAEIVRGSIQAVHRGQTEATQALSLSDLQRLRFVVLPQAFRIAVPPLANQYLNLTKNSSLAIAIAFAEFTQVTKTVIGNGNPAPQSFLILMAGYLFLSLVISFLSNIVNRRLQLATR
jgi:general L-amino acid transport system permease protein